MSAAPTLIFDLDGTLSDPAEGIGRSINYALEAAGFAPIALANVSQFIGPPLDHSFRAITGLSSPALIEQLVARYRERYADVGYAENVLYSGIPEALAALAAAGVAMGVCTSKRVDFAQRILERFGLRARFGFVSGGDVGLHKDQQLAALLRERRIDAASVMIGDRSFDVLAARSNGLRSVGVLWGHGTAAELAAAGADEILQTVPQLARLRPAPLV